MTFLEKVKEQHDEIKAHKFRDGESFLTATVKELNDFISLYYDFIGNYYRSSYIKEDTKYYDDIYMAGNHVSEEQKVRNQFKMGCYHEFVHDARGTILSLRYYRDHEDFKSFANSVIALLDCYVMQVHEFLDHGQVTFAYFIRRYSNDKIIELYSIDLREQEKLDVKTAKLIKRITIPTKK
jgi:hypothetical protein